MFNSALTRFGALGFLCVIGLNHAHAQNAVDAAGNIYTVGSFGQTVDFNPGPGVYNLTALGVSDIFVQKLNNAGQFLWARRFGSAKSDFPERIVLRGDLYIQGYSVSPSDNREIILTKIASSGRFAWIKRFAWVDDETVASGPAQVRDMIIDKDGAIITAGSVGSTTDFRPGAGEFLICGCTDVRWEFVSKLDKHGNFMWAGSISSGQDDNFIRALSSDAEGNLYMSGDFQNGVFHLPSGGFLFNAVDLVEDCPERRCDSFDAFVVKVSTAGDLIWQRAMGWRGSDTVGGVIQ